VRLARIVEAVAGGVLLGFSVWQITRAAGVPVPAAVDVVAASMAAMAGVFVLVDALTSAWLPARIVSWAMTVSARYRAAPLRLGPLRAWNPEALALALLLLADATVAAITGGVPGLALAAVALVGAAYLAWLALAPTTGRDPRVPWWVRLSRLPPRRLRRVLERAAAWMAPRIAPLLRVTPREAVSLAAGHLFLGLLLALAAILSLALIVGVPALLALLLAPVPLAARLAGAIAERRRLDKAARQELPFIATLASLAAQAGLPLEWALERLASPDFPAAPRIREAPSARDLLLGYTAILHSGGDVARYLEGWAGKGLESLRVWLRGFLHAMSGMATVIAGVAGLGMAIGVVAALLPQGSPILILLFSLVVVPASVALGIIIVEAMAPRLLDHYDTRRELAAALTGASLALAVSAALGAPAWAAAGAALAGGLAGLGIVWRLERRIVELEEAGVEEALERIVEARRLGTPLAESLRYAAETVNPVAGEKLLKAWRRARATGSLAGSWQYWRSWLGRAVMRLLAAAEDAGATQPRHILLLAETVREYRRIRREARAELGQARAVALAAPPIIAVMIVFLEYLSGKLVSLPGFIQPVPEVYFAQAKIAVFILALGLGLFASKLADFTIRNTLLTAAAVAASLAVLLAP